MPTLRTCAVAVVALGLLTSPSRAQSVYNLPVSLFERYLEALRQQVGIPGLSAALIQNGQVVWDRGYGYQDVDGLVAATARTPYPILDLSQALSSTLLLQQCMELRHLGLADRVRRWAEQFPDDATVAQLLSHAAPDGRYLYDPSRYETLTTIVEQCTSAGYASVFTEEILDRLGMAETVPGHNLADAPPERPLFSAGAFERYAAVLQRTATPHRVDSRGRPSRSAYSRPALGASTGVVSTVRDLARFDAALDDDVLIEDQTRRRAWEPAAATPTGLGWFVQHYNGERIVWHFGLARDAYSGLYIKVPDRHVTLILLANSDGLAAPYTLSQGDVTASLFAQLFLRLFVP